MKRLTLSMMACCASIGTAEASVKDYHTCMQAYVNMIGYLHFANPQGMEAERAAFEVDFNRFVTMGVERYGEEVVRTLAPDPEESFIKSILPLHSIDGPEKTTAVLLKMVAPCGGPNGELRAFYPE